MPRDEAFSDIKNDTFSAKTLYSVLHGIVPSLEAAVTDPDEGFPFFPSIESLYHEGFQLLPLENQGFLRNALPRLVKAMEDTREVLRFEIPDTMMSRTIIFIHLCI